jgi:CheY-like chemotaxis protein
MGRPVGRKAIFGRIFLVGEGQRGGAGLASSLPTSKYPIGIRRPGIWGARKAELGSPKTRLSMCLWWTTMPTPRKRSPRSWNWHSRASDGLAHLAIRRFNGIVSDFDMPGMDGVEFLTHAKDLQPSTVRILLTASDRIMDDQQAGVIHDVLSKSLAADRIALVLGRLLSVGHG